MSKKHLIECEETARSLLEQSGYRFDSDGTIWFPHKGYKPSDTEEEAVEFLVENYDYFLE